jgi:hypothetical protein
MIWLEYVSIETTDAQGQKLRCFELSTLGSSHLTPNTLYSFQGQKTKPLPTSAKAKQSHYMPWWRLGGEEV